MDLQDKVIAITGGGRGLGRAMAVQFAERGAKLALVDLDQEALDVTASLCEEVGSQARTYQANVASEASVVELFERIVADFGALHGLVNNAGITRDGLFVKVKDGEIVNKMSLEQWQQVIDVNLTGVFHGMRFGLPEMVKAGGGAIVNMASILGSVGFATAGAYVAAKHGVVGLTKVAAIEYAKAGVRVNAVGPGFIATPLLEKHLDAAALDGIAALHPIGRLGEAAEVSAMTCFLLSDQASFITGSYHLVDGGYTAQ